jgi:transposase-like protein
MKSFAPCPHCGSSERPTNYGLPRAGSQRYGCHACQRPDTLVAQQQGYASETRPQAVQMSVDGLPLRRIGRLLGGHHQTLRNGVNAYQTRLKAPPPALPKPERVETVEVDERYPFLGQKKTKSRSSLP